MLEADPAVDPVIAVKWITDDSERARLAIQLMAIEEAAGRVLVQDVKRAVIE